MPYHISFKEFFMATLSKNFENVLVALDKLNINFKSNINWSSFFTKSQFGVYVPHIDNQQVELFYTWKAVYICQNDN